MYYLNQIHNFLKKKRKVFFQNQILIRAEIDSETVPKTEPYFNMISSDT